MLKKINFIHLLIPSAVIAAIRILVALYYPPLQNWKPIAIVVVVLAFIFTLATERMNKKILYAVPLGFVIVNIIQIIVEVIADRTSHNLAPFEIILLALTALLAALIGVGLGFVIKKLLYKGDSMGAS